MTRLLAGFVCGCLPLLLAAGCGSTKPPELVPVSGKVYLGEKPLPNVIVRFWAHKQNVSNADTLTKANGSYELKLPPGKYDVTLMAVPAAGQQPADPSIPPSPDKKTGAPGRSGFPARYLARETTAWRSLEIPDLGRNHLDLEIKD